MTIREALPSDADAIRALARQLATTFAFDDTAFARLYSQNHASVLVAESNTEIIGYLLGQHHSAFWAGGDIWWVEEIFVRAEARRQGIAGALMAAFESRARAAGAKLVCLATRRASDFYRAIGYEESATYFRKLLY